MNPTVRAGARLHSRTRELERFSNAEIAAEILEFCLARGMVQHLARRRIAGAAAECRRRFEPERATPCTVAVLQLIEIRFAHRARVSRAIARTIGAALEDAQRADRGERTTFYHGGVSARPLKVTA